MERGRSGVAGLGLPARSSLPAATACPRRESPSCSGERLRLSACGERNSLFVLGFQTTCKITIKWAQLRSKILGTKGRFQASAAAGTGRPRCRGSARRCFCVLARPRGRHHRTLELAQINYLQHLMARFGLFYISFPSFTRKIFDYSSRLSSAALLVLLWYPKTVDDKEENNFKEEM